MKCPVPDKPRYQDRTLALLAIEEHRRRYPDQNDDFTTFLCPTHRHVRDAAGRDLERSA